MVVTDDDRRTQFMLHMYDNYCSNIGRAEDSSWRTMTAVTVLFAAFAYLGDVLTGMGESLWSTALNLFVITLILTFAITSTLRHILLYARNLTLLSRIELAFLDDKDYGSLVPKSFKRSGEKFIRPKELWTIQLVYYLALLGVTLSVALFSSGIGFFLLFTFSSLVPSYGAYHYNRKRLKEIHLELKENPPAKKVG